MLATKSRSPLVAGAGSGLVWGVAAYALLWGHTSIVVHRSFVVSPIGTILLLPVRVVLWAIRAAEGVAGRPFDLSTNHWWIGLAAGITGAIIAAVAAWTVATLAVAVRRSGRKRVPESPESL